MPEHLPEFVEPASLCEKRAHLRGSIELGSLDRLTDLLLDPRGQANLDLRFGKSGRRLEIRGSVSADLVLECQSCLEPLVFPVNCPVNLAAVTTVDEALLLPEDVEALMVEADGKVTLADVVQDELLLAVPVIPRHVHCNSPRLAGSESTRPNPFAQLAALKKQT